MRWGKRRGPHFVLVMMSVVAGLVLAAVPAQARVWVDDTPAASWGVNGRVYATVIAGDTMVVGGKFTSAVSSTGTTVARKNLAAFSMATGELLTGWRADAGATVYALVTDGTSVWAGGSFAKVGGSVHSRVAKIAAGNGAVDNRFTATVDNTVRALALDSGSLYLGGAFRNANGATRTRLAKVDDATGALDGSFVASANNVVKGLVRNPVTDVLYASGLFSTLGDAARNGVGAVSATTGATTSTVFASAARPTLGLTINPDGSRLFGAGGSGSNAAAAWNTSTGARTWRVVTDGDIQAIAYYDNTVYFGFHDGYQTDAAIKMLAANADTGQLQAFYPRFDGFWGVFAIAATEAGVVAGGEFSGVNGVIAPNLARFTPLAAPKADPVVVSYLGATTDWSYWDANSRPTDWQNLNFADGSWAVGKSQLGYGDGDEQTVISYGGDPNNHNVTAYFRTKFTVDKVPDLLKLELLADDGAVVYLNGVEVVRDNMPTGTIAHSTLAATNRTGGPENALRPFSLNPAKLRIGGATNVLAVEVHQSNVTSDDLSFDLSLTGQFSG